MGTRFLLHSETEFSTKFAAKFDRCSAGGKSPLQKALVESIKLTNNALHVNSHKPDWETRKGDIGGSRLPKQPAAASFASALLLQCCLVAVAPFWV